MGRVPMVEETWAGALLCWGTTRIRLDSPAWWAWLEEPTTRSFRYGVFDPAQGYLTHMVTVRKERRQRGGQYWVAYQRVAGHLQKAYLGVSGTLTAERLRNVAGQLQRKEVIVTAATSM